MADQKAAPGAATGDLGYDFSNSITPEEYQTIERERNELVQKQLQARGEFMFKHYDRLLRAMDVTFERAAKAKVLLDKRARRAEAKKRREQLAAAKRRP